MHNPKQLSFAQRLHQDDGISSIGLILDEAITFKKVQEDLVKLLSSDCTDSAICTILDISQDLLDKFKLRVKRKIKKVNVDLGLQQNDIKSKERLFWDFIKETTGDVDLLSWPSYYACLDRVKKEIDNVIHAVDKSFSKNRESHASGRGIFFQRPDLVNLLRLNFKRKYQKDIIQFVSENKINVFKITCKEVDKTTLLPATREKGHPYEVRVIRFINIKILEDSFKSVMEARLHANQIEKEKLNKLLEIKPDNVFTDEKEFENDQIKSVPRKS
jgi:hypothetical protein